MHTPPPYLNRNPARWEERLRRFMILGWPSNNRRNRDTEKWPQSWSFVACHGGAEGPRPAMGRGDGNPVDGDSEQCSRCGEMKDYASDGIYLCMLCL